MAGEALRELLAVFGIEVDDKALKNADKLIEGFQKKLEHVGKTVAQAFYVKELYEFVKGQAEMASHLQELSMRLDVGATQLRSFGFLAQDAGVEFEGAANSLGLLRKNMGEAASKGGEAAKAFRDLHIDIKDTDTGAARPLVDILADVADAMQDLPDQNARAAASMKLFGREGRALVPIFSQGGDAFREAMKEAEGLSNGLGDDFYKRVKEAADGFEHAQFALESLKERALAAVLPLIADLGKALQGTVKALLDLDKKTHVVQATFVTLTAIAGVALVNALRSAAVAAWELLVPLIAEFGIPVAIVGGLVWVFQDLAKAINGDESVLTKMITRLLGVDEGRRFVEQLKEMWDALKDAIGGAMYALGYFIGVSYGLGKAASGGEDLLGIFVGLLKIIMAVTRATLGLVQTLEAIPEAIKKGDWGPITKAIDTTGEAIFGKRGILGEAGLGQHSTDIRDYGVNPEEVAMATAPRREPRRFRRNRPRDFLEFDRTGTREMRGFARTHPVIRVPGTGAPAAGATVQQQNVNHVVVHTASDHPKEIGDAVGQGVATATQKDLNAALAAVVKP